jgi:hypothetical protein
VPGKVGAEERLHDDPEYQRVHLLREVERALVSEPGQELGAVPLHDGQVGLAHLGPEQREESLALVLVLVGLGQEVEVGSEQTAREGQAGADGKAVVVGVLEDPPGAVRSQQEDGGSSARPQAEGLAVLGVAALKQPQLVT